MQPGSQYFPTLRPPCVRIRPPQAVIEAWDAGICRLIDAGVTGTILLANVASVQGFSVRATAAGSRPGVFEGCAVVVRRQNISEFRRTNYTLGILPSESGCPRISPVRVASCTMHPAGTVDWRHLYSLQKCLLYDLWCYHDLVYSGFIMMHSDAPVLSAVLSSAEWLVVACCAKATSGPIHSLVWSTLFVLAFCSFSTALQPPTLTTWSLPKQTLELSDWPRSTRKSRFSTTSR